jgi:hypothetical protein
MAMELEPCQDTPGIVDLVVLLVEEQKHWQHWYHITSIVEVIVH